MISLSSDESQGPKKFARKELLAMWLECRASETLNPKVNMKTLDEDVKFKLFYHYAIDFGCAGIDLGEEKYIDLGEKFKEKLTTEIKRNKWELFSWQDPYTNKTIFMFTGESGENLFKVWKN